MAAREAQSRYCDTSGRSRPSWTRTRSMSSPLATSPPNAVARSPETRSSMNATKETVTATSAAIRSLCSVYFSMGREAARAAAGRALLPARAIHVRNLVRGRLELHFVGHGVEVDVRPQRHPVGVARNEGVRLVVQGQALRRIDFRARLLHQVDHFRILRRVVGS